MRGVFILFGIWLSSTEVLPVEIPKLYQIKKSDTLMTISFQFYGTHQCHEVIKKANPQLMDSNRLEVGSEILVPDPLHCTKPVARNSQQRLQYQAPEKPAVDLEPVPCLSYFSYDAQGKLKREIVTLKETQIPGVRDFFKPTLIHRKGSIALDSDIKESNRRPASVPALTPQHWVQLMATPIVTEAQGLCDRQDVLELKSHCQIQQFQTDKTWYRVRLGPFKNEEEARALKKKILQQKISQAFTISTYGSSE
jgi:hypothetical protein